MRLMAIEELSNLYQATILESISVGTIGALIGTGILEILKISRVFMLSSRGIETITKNLSLSKSVIQEESDITSKSFFFGYTVPLNTLVNDATFLIANPSNFFG